MRYKYLKKTREEHYFSKFRTLIKPNSFTGNPACPIKCILYIRDTIYKYIHEEGRMLYKRKSICNCQELHVLHEKENYFGYSNRFYH